MSNTHYFLVQGTISISEIKKEETKENKIEESKIEEKSVIRLVSVNDYNRDWNLTYKEGAKVLFTEYYEGLSDKNKTYSVTDCQVTETIGANYYPYD